MAVILPSTQQPFVDQATGMVNQAWYLALLNLNNSIPVGVVTSVNLIGTNGITAAGGPITSVGVFTVSLAPTGVTLGTYGNSTNVPVVSINAQGQVTSVGTVAIAYPAAGAGTVTSIEVVGFNGITVTSALIQTAGTVNLGIGNLTCTNVLTVGTVTAARAIVSGTVTAADVVATATVLAANIRATATITSVNAIITGTITAADIVASATILGANIRATATVTAVNVVATGGVVVGGTVTAADIVATATILAANIRATATVTTVNAIITGTVTAANIVSTATILAANIRATATVSSVNVIATGTVTAADIVSTASILAANIRATATVTASDIVSSATILAANIRATATVTTVNAIITGTVTAADIVASATILAANISATTTVTSANAIITATITAANVVSTQTVASVGVVATGRIEPATTFGIKGTASNDSANAGSFGEFISTGVSSASSVSLGTGAAVNVASVALTAGDWDVGGNAVFSQSQASTTIYQAGISTVSATRPASEFYSSLGLSTTVARVTNSLILPVTRISVTSSTTTYMIMSCTFSAGTVRGFGVIQARRMR